MKNFAVFPIALAMVFVATTAVFAEDAAPQARTPDTKRDLDIIFSQIHGAKPQAPVELTDDQLSDAEMKQLDKIMNETGILDVSSFKQFSPMSFGSSLYNLSIVRHGQLHNATFDDKTAAPACLKLVRFVVKHGTKYNTTIAQKDDSAPAEAAPAASAGKEQK